MKNKILLILLIIAGAVIGSLVASATTDVNNFSWLAYSKSVSVAPFTINLVIIKLTFGFDFAMSIAQIIFMIVGVAVYPKLKKVIAG